MDKISIKQARKELKQIGYKLSTRSVPMCGDSFLDINLIFEGKTLGSIFSPQSYEKHKAALDIFNRIDKKL
jgi:hypothetical protein